MRNFRFLFFFTLWIGVIGGGANPLFAQDTALPESTLKEEVDALDQKVRILERRLEPEKENETHQKGSANPVGRKDRFILKSADDDVLKFKGLFQFDGFFFLQNNPPVSTFNPRKVRPYFEGTVAKYYDFRLLPDFGDGKTVLQEAYLDIHYWPEIRLEVGKFKSPVGLERLQSDTNLIFFERALSANLVPNRDVGFVLHGDPWKGAISYALGILNGVADGAVLDADSNSDKDGVARVFVQPFRNSGIASLNGLGIGIAGTYGNQQKASTSSPNLPSYKTSGQQTIFSYTSTGTGTVVAEGQRIRFSPQAYYYYGPFGLLGEYVSSSLNVTKGTNSTTLTHTAWQTAASFVLTGEKASYNGVIPENAFDPGNGKWGAFELAIRYSKLDLDSNAFPIYADAAKSSAGAREWGGGVNWTLNKNIKMALDYFDTSFDPAGGGVHRNDENVVLTRFQLAF